MSSDIMNRWKRQIKAKDKEIGTLREFLKLSKEQLDQYAAEIERLKETLKEIFHIPIEKGAIGCIEIAEQALKESEK